ncbi:conserved hypothetical protein [Magnetococcus marinus MC-1]|uniref:Uncharacterized protein n=1 Tax=Magnetococcus marinus (strain ATCC BAA-1437 / JCM 17883 / MC-1) TaxID=156889 RepID=A0L9X8_MAGMM|nr:hypothetical protein [Magnetococcus marinus]ABK44771.1 conserved hypothetical protein [Magnetococcus marinus MC-1]
MAITNLNATLVEGERVTLTGPGKVKFKATKPIAKALQTMKAATPAKTATVTKAATATKIGVAQGAATQAAATTTKAAAATSAVPVAAAGSSSVLGAMGLNVGLGLGSMGTLAVGALIIGGGYYLYRRQKAKRFWSF